MSQRSSATGQAATAAPGWRRLLPTRGRLRALAAYLACVLAVAVVAAPICIERSVQEVQFTDQLGTFPVEVSLSHNGYSTLDTGIFGRIYLHKTGFLGFGAYARSTGPPEAGGTLASYVNPKFIQANVSLIEDPGKVVHAYSVAMARDFRGHLLVDELIAGFAGGAVLFLLLPRRRMRTVPRRALVVASAGLLVAGTAVSGGIAWQLFQGWQGTTDPGQTYAIPEVSDISFGSPQTQEVAAQVKPFIEKNSQRIDERARQYEQNARASFAAALPSRIRELLPRRDEKIVIAEADPQGSFVGARVRRSIDRNLVDTLGVDAFAARTIAGDITSNGTVSEGSYVAQEAEVTPRIPTVAVGGDHDSTTTWKQMKDRGMTVPDLTTEEVGGLRIAGANDREHKTLFGGMVTDTAGVSEEELGHKVRKVVDGESDPQRGRIVLLHQPYAAAPYLGLDTIDTVRALDDDGTHRTTPYDDGIPDQPPGIVDYGHWHQLDGPWVLWNTDGGEVTWTVVDQLGTAGGAENAPTFSRFSTPFSAPLKPLTVRLQYVNTRSGLETGYATIRCDLGAHCTISGRTDVGLPGGMPEPLDTVRAPEPPGVAAGGVPTDRPSPTGTPTETPSQPAPESSGP